MLFSLASRIIFVQPERISSTPVGEQFKEVIGSGPYRFLADEFQAGAIAHYARWDKYVPRSEPPDFWSGGHVANFDRVEWTAQPDSSTAAAALQRGEVDWLQQPLLDLVPMLGQTGGIKIEAVDQFGNLAILRFNHLLPPFDNPEMQRAVLPGIDQMAVAGDQAEFGRTPVGFFTAGGPMANDAGIQALTGPRSPTKSAGATPPERNSAIHPGGSPAHQLQPPPSAPCRRATPDDPAWAQRRSGPPSRNRARSRRFRAGSRSQDGLHRIRRSWPPR